MCYVVLVQQMYHVLRGFTSADVSCVTWVYFSRCIMCSVGLVQQTYHVLRGISSADVSCVTWD